MTSKKTNSGVVKHLLNREIGKYARRRYMKNTLLELAEDRAAKPVLNKSVELPGVARATFLMVFSPDGTKIASTHGDHSVRVSTVATGRCEHVLTGHPRTPWCVAFHPNSDTILASGCLGGEVRIWDLHGGGSEVWQNDRNKVIHSIAFHPTDQLLVIATSNQILFWDWNQSEPTIKCTTSHEYEKVRWVSFDPLGQYLYTGICNGSTVIREDHAVVHMGDEDSGSDTEQRQALRQRYYALMDLYRLHHQQDMENRAGAPETSQQPSVDLLMRDDEPSSMTHRPLRIPQRPPNNLQDRPANPTERPSNLPERPSNPPERPSNPPERLSNPPERPSNPLERSSNLPERPTNASERQSAFSSSSTSNRSTNWTRVMQLRQRLHDLRREQSAARNASERMTAYSRYLARARAAHAERENDSDAVSETSNMETNSNTESRLPSVSNTGDNSGHSPGNVLPNTSGVSENSDGFEPTPILRSQLAQQSETVVVNDTLHLTETEHTSQASDWLSPLAQEGSTSSDNQSTPTRVRLNLALQNPGSATVIQPSRRNQICPERNCGNTGSTPGTSEYTCPQITISDCPVDVSTNQQSLDSQPVHHPPETLLMTADSDSENNCDNTSSSELGNSSLPSSSSSSSHPASATSSVDPQPTDMWASNLHLLSDISTESSAHFNYESQSRNSSESSGGLSLPRPDFGNVTPVSESGPSIAEQLRSLRERNREASNSAAAEPLSYESHVGRLGNSLASSRRLWAHLAQDSDERLSGTGTDGEFSSSWQGMRENYRQRQMRLRQYLNDIRRRYERTRPENNNREEGSDFRRARIQRYGRDFERRAMLDPMNRPYLPSRLQEAERRQRENVLEMDRLRADILRRRRERRESDRTWRTLQRRHLHPDYAVNILDETINQPSDALQAAINRTIAGAFMGTGEAAVANNIDSLTHRIQRWDLSEGTPDLADVNRNVVVPNCKLHNEASCSLSQDGSLLATFVSSQRGFPEDTVLAVFSLNKESLGHCLYTKCFGPNAISVSISPLGRYVLVGLAAKRLAWVFTQRQVVGQVFKLDAPHGGELSMKHTSDVVHPCTDGDVPTYVTVNSAVWLPMVGSGLAYGTNRGDLRICTPGHAPDADQSETEDSNNGNSSIRRNLMHMLGLTVPRTMSTATQTVRTRQSASTQTSDNELE